MKESRRKRRHLNDPLYFSYHIHNGNNLWFIRNPKIRSDVCMTQIIIEFDSSDYDAYFFNDIKESMEISKFKPENLAITLKEKLD